MGKMDEVFEGALSPVLSLVLDIFDLVRGADYSSLDTGKLSEFHTLVDNRLEVVPDESVHFSQEMSVVVEVGLFTNSWKLTGLPLQNSLTNTIFDIEMVSEVRGTGTHDGFHLQGEGRLVQLGDLLRADL